MKILLLTDIPPCRNFTAGIVLDQLCSFLPAGSLACFSVIDRTLDPQITPNLSWMPIEYHEKPRENWRVLPRRLGSLASLVGDSYTRLLVARKIASRAIKFGKRFNADTLWCILQGQTMIRLALPVSRGLGVRLLTEVWDPPTWWLRAKEVDRITASRVLHDFERALRASASCATASWAMAEQYKRDFGTETIPFLPSLKSDLAMAPAEEPHPGTEFIIGMAGQLYATDEWDALTAALDGVNWRIRGRGVRIRLMGRWVNLQASGKLQVEFLGWRSQEETIRLLSEADVLYCPYWFDPAFETEARLSFPSKLTTYLAAGRPVLFHGPPYASPARFLDKHGAGVCCYSAEPTEVIRRLDQLASDTDLYAEVTKNGRMAFEKYLTLSTLRKSFFEFLQAKEDEEATAHVCTHGDSDISQMAAA
jgi:hypothetical protein